LLRKQRRPAGNKAKVNVRRGLSHNKKEPKQLNKESIDMKGVGKSFVAKQRQHRVAPCVIT
jgi:hypothetical protein